MAKEKKTMEDVTPNSVLGWIEKTVAIIDKYGIIKIVQALLIFVMAFILIYCAANPEKVFDIYIDYKDQAHSELIVQRTKNTPRIQEACDELLLRSGADRVLFMELHNNTGNISGMPFFYASASCESLDDGIRPISDQYLEIKLSLFPFSTYIFKNKYWAGDMEKMKDIDKSLYYKMMSNGVHHTEFLIVEGVDMPCGIIMASYEENPLKKKEHNCEEVREELERTARKIGMLIEAPKFQ